MLCNLRLQSQHLVGQVVKCALKDSDGTDDEEEEQGTETRRSAPQNKIRKDGRPKCYRCGKPGHLHKIVGLQFSSRETSNSWCNEACAD